MLGSNVVLLACKYALGGELWRLQDPFWWLGAATLYSDASISIVLAPTVLLLAATPGLLALERRMSSLWFAILAIAAFVVAWALYLTSPAPPFPNAAGAGLVILPLATNGLIGLVMGLWLSRHAERRRMLEPRVVGSAFVGVLVLLVSLAPTPLVQMTVGTVLRFGAILALAVMCGTGARRPLVRGISQLGRYSLSVFILHRPVIQAIQFLISRVELSASLRYACLYPLTLGCMLVLCAARDRDDRVDRMLRAVRL